MKPEELMTLKRYAGKVMDMNFCDRMAQMEKCREVVARLKRSVEKINNVRRMRQRKYNKENDDECDLVFNITPQEDLIEYIEDNIMSPILRSKYYIMI